MQRLGRWLPAFGMRLSDHSKGDTGYETCRAADAVDALGHCAMAAVPALDRVGCGRQQLVVEQCEGGLQGGRADLLQGVSSPCEPLHPTTQRGQRAEGGVGAAATVEQRVDVFHDLAELPQMGHATGHVPQSRVFGLGPPALDEHKAVLAHVGDL